VTFVKLLVVLLFVDPRFLSNRGRNRLHFFHTLNSAIAFDG